MAVRVQSHADRTVAQDFLDDLGMHPHTQEKHCGTVPQVVKPDGRKSRLLEYCPKVLLDTACWFEAEQLAEPHTCGEGEDVECFLLRPSSEMLAVHLPSLRW